MISDLIDISTARELLRQSVPTWEEMLATIESAGGRIKFRREMSSALQNLKLESYPLLYERPAAAGVLVMQAMMDPEEIAAFNSQMEGATAAERGQALVEILSALSELDCMELSPPPDEMVRLQAEFESLDESGKQVAVRAAQYVLAASLMVFYEYLSVAVHDVKLSVLVEQAKLGDDVAYGKAIQIDGRILTVIPYFRDRYARANTDDDEKFLSMVSRKRSKPPYRGKIKHKSLFMTFAFFEGCGLLNSLTGEQLLDVCDFVGVGRSGAHIDDVKNLRKRLSEYRRFQKTGRVSTP